MKSITRKGTEYYMLAKLQQAGIWCDELNRWAKPVKVGSKWALVKSDVDEYLEWYGIKVN